MTSAFELFPKHEHSKTWITAAWRNPEICPGKDPEDTKCTCPDVVYATRIRLRTGHSFDSFFYCGCCDKPIT